MSSMSSDERAYCKQTTQTVSKDIQGRRGVVCFHGREFIYKDMKIILYGDHPSEGPQIGHRILWELDYS